MLDVNDWKWKREDVDRRAREGSVAVQEGILQLLTGGLNDDSVRNETIAILRRGIDLLKGALAAETPASPLPYAALAKGYSCLVICSTFPDFQKTDEAMAFLFQAKECASKASELYECTVGWDPGRRSDMHTALAQACLLMKSVDDSIEQTQLALRLKADNGFLEDWLVKLSETVAALEGEKTMPNPDSDLEMIEMRPTRSDLTVGGQNALEFRGEDYNNGEWQRIIKMSESSIAEFVNALPSSSLEPEVPVNLFYAAQAYRALGEKEKYLACLKILYSLDPYQHVFGGQYQTFIERGAREYRAAKKAFGASYLNNLQVTGLFKKSGCFVATACYGHPDAVKVLLLRDFRDHALSRTGLGRWLIDSYYRIARPIADWTSKSARRRTLMRSLLIGPVVAILRRNGCHEVER